MSEYGITAENLLRTLPPMLANDAGMHALGETLAGALTELAALPRMVNIYSRIDELDEGLLDVLAKDFKVDWYGYNFPIDAKRAQLKDSFHVHRHLGARGATEKALRDIYPGTEVEEWYEYDGRPYYFRVLLDVTNQRVAITHDEIVRQIGIYKSLRSRIEKEAITYRSWTGVTIGGSTNHVTYPTLLCGTLMAGNQW